MKLVIFDLDGVITTEATYWDIARRGLKKLLSSKADVLPLDFIYWAKNHAINHNWDVAFVALAASADREQFKVLHDHLTGRALLEACPGYREVAWRDVHQVCQEIQDRSPLPDRGLHSKPETRAMFEILEARGYELAVATGRPKSEAIAPLEQLGILRYLREDRIITHWDVQEAERTANVPLGKPHPFVVLRAMYPLMPVEEVLALPAEARQGVWFIGDTASDVSAALGAGVVPIGVVSAIPPGAYRNQRRETLSRLGCRVILDSVLELPEYLERLIMSI